MIDFSKIKITKEKLGTFGDIRLSGGIDIKAFRNLNNNQDKEAAQLEIKKELFNQIYGDLVGPVEELKRLVNDYILTSNNSIHSYHPYFVNDKEVKELIGRLDELLERPE